MAKLLGLILVSYLFAAPLCAWDLREVSSETSYIRNKTDAYMPQYTSTPNGLLRNDDDNENWWYGLALNINIDVVRYGKFKLFWDNRFFTDATDSQVRHVGWQWKLGFPITPKLVFYQYHESRHCMECNTDASYPRENRFVIKYIFKGDKQ